MIHSLAGGNIGNESYNDFALVKILEGTNQGNKAWYKSIKGVNIGDTVLVPYSEENVKAKVIRVDKDVSSFASPVPVKRAKTIIRKV